MTETEAKTKGDTMTTPDLDARIAAAKEQLKTLIRIHNPGGCRMFSRGHECNCLLCLVDDLVADWERLRQRVAELEEAWKPIASFLLRCPMNAEYTPVMPIDLFRNYAAVLKENGQPTTTR